MGTKKVYEAICAVQGEIAKIGIRKDQTNEQQRYMFRGIDDIYNTMAPLLAKHKLCIIPRCQSRAQTERKSNSGGALFSVVLDTEYDIVSAEDGSCHVARLPGESMDSGDKGTNKAMSAGYKYLCFQMFCIPTEGDNDADGTTHEVAAEKPATAPQRTATAPPVPAGQPEGMIVSGKVEKKGVANKGGYIPYTLLGVRLDDGTDIKFTTKNPDLVNKLDGFMKGGIPVMITATKTDYKGYCSIDSVEATADRAPF